MVDRLARAVGLAILALACTAVRAQGYVYWTSTASSATVGRANLDGSGANARFITAGHPSFGLAVDGGRIYWTTGVGAVARANLDGTGVDQGFIRNVNPIGLAVDGAHLYWASLRDAVGRASLDGSTVEQNFIAGDSDLGTEDVEPFGVAVSGPYVYWINKSSGWIGRANADGTGVTVRFIRTGSPSSTALAADGTHIYWNDDETNTIARANLDGSRVDLRFITGAGDPIGVAVDGAHVYWSNNVGATIGRANLDGSGVNQRFITGVPGASLAVDGLGPTERPAPPRPPSPPAGKNGLKGLISLNFLGGRVKGYRVSLGGEVGSTGAGIDNLRISLTKGGGNRLLRSHEWTVALPRDAITIDRAKASIVVNDALGPGGADGVLAFAIRGRPKRTHFACRRQANALRGTLNGTIRINVGDQFFKTITVTRMRGTATGTQTAPRGCPPPPCPTQSWLRSYVPPTSGQGISIDANATRLNGRRRSSLVLGVFEPTAGTPFAQIYHSLAIGRSKPLFSATRTLNHANVSTPGGAISGGLRLTATASLKRRALPHCPHGIASRPATVASGAITGRFDSIGTIVFDTNLNSGFTVPPMLNRI